MALLLTWLNNHPQRRCFTHDIEGKEGACSRGAVAHLALSVLRKEVGQSAYLFIGEFIPMPLPTLGGFLPLKPLISSISILMRRASLDPANQPPRGSRAVCILVSVVGGLARYGEWIHHQHHPLQKQAWNSYSYPALILPAQTYHVAGSPACGKN